MKDTDLDLYYSLISEKLPKDSVDVQLLLTKLSDSLTPVEFQLKMYDILSGLDSNGSAVLEKLKDVDKLVRCSTIELNPEVNQPIIESVEKRNEKPEYKNLCTEYTCRNCKKNKTITRFIHRRCLDEASDMEIRCKNCNTVWISK